MQAYVSRDSVCMADDCDAPNEYRLNVKGAPSVEGLIELVWLARPLPQIAGGGKPPGAFHQTFRLPLSRSNGKSRG